jgi:hypothetical protein
MAQTEAATVRKQVVVDAPIERAFTVFTDRFGDFKPPEHNMLGAPAPRLRSECLLANRDYLLAGRALTWPVGCP